MRYYTRVGVSRDKIRHAIGSGGSLAWAACEGRNTAWQGTRYLFTKPSEGDVNCLCCLAVLEEVERASQ
jgi:hypothetical protein